LFYINPSRRGPAVPAGSPRRTPTPRRVESLLAAPGLEGALDGNSDKQGEFTWLIVVFTLEYPRGLS